MGKNLRVLIVDDEPLAREKIRQFLSADPQIDIVGECEDGTAAVAALQQSACDLLFLDVQMPELDGFAVIDAVGIESLPAVIFVTAYDKYALKAFEVHAVDYLLKPFDRERFQKALQQAKNHIQQQQSAEVNERLISLLEDLRGEKTKSRQSTYAERLVLKSGGRVYFLKTNEIDWIEAAGNYVRLNLGKESHLLRDSMGNLESKLNPKDFLRIHRSTMVRIDFIKELQSWFHGEYMITLNNGRQMTSSRGYRERIVNLLSRLN